MKTLTSAEAVPVQERGTDGWKWMTNPTRNNGSPIPVQIYTVDGEVFYRPFDCEATDFEWSERSDDWREVAPPAAQPAPTVAYSIDADPSGIRKRAADAIIGALALGAQDSSPPPEGHWLQQFWDIGRADASKTAGWKRVGGGLVAIKNLLSRDPCAHATLAIERIDDMLNMASAKHAPHGPIRPVIGPPVVDCHATGVCVQSGLRAEQPAVALTHSQARDEQYPLPDDMYDSKDWREANYVGRVEWLHTMYESQKKTLDAYTTTTAANEQQGGPHAPAKNDG